MIDNTQLGSLIHSLRVQKRLTMRDLEALTGIPISRISDFERGLAEPKLSAALKLAQVLGVSIDELAGLTNGEVVTEPNGDAAINSAFAEVKACEAKVADAHTTLQQAKQELVDAQAKLRWAKREAQRKTLDEQIELRRAKKESRERLKTIMPPALSSEAKEQQIEEFHRDYALNNVDLLASPSEQEIVDEETLSTHERKEGKHERMRKIVSDLQAKSAVSGR